MRTFIAILLLLLLSGCGQESKTDPYLAAINKYLDSLNAAETFGGQVEPPPKPVYLQYPVQMEPFPFTARAGFTAGSMSNTAGMGGLSTRLQANCEQTNTARKQAYEKAVQRYEKVISDRDSRAANIDSR
jgi:hypothetical protein